MASFGSEATTRTVLSSTTESKVDYSKVCDLGGQVAETDPKKPGPQIFRQLRGVRRGTDLPIEQIVRVIHYPVGW
jgi:hypothetical protein